MLNLNALTLKDYKIKPIFVTFIIIKQYLRYQMILALLRLNGRVLSCDNITIMFGRKKMNGKLLLTGL